LTIEDANGNSSSDSLTIVVNSEGEKMNIIFESNPPNPNNPLNQAPPGFAQIEVINKPIDTSVMSITIHDVGGRYVGGFLAQEVIINDTTFQVPISNLTNGLYLVRVVMNDNDSTLLKLMVNN